MILNVNDEWSTPNVGDATFFEHAFDGHGLGSGVFHIPVHSFVECDTGFDAQFGHDFGADGRAFVERGAVKRIFE